MKRLDSCRRGLEVGLPGLVAVINERYIVTADGIAYYNWLGRKKAEIAWKDVVAFEFKRKVGGKGGPTYYYTLVGKDNHIDLDTLITQWKDLAKIILTRMPQEATVDLGPYSLPV